MPPTTNAAKTISAMTSPLIFVNRTNLATNVLQA